MFCLHPGSDFFWLESVSIVCFHVWAEKSMSPLLLIFGGSLSQLCYLDIIESGPAVSATAFYFFTLFQPRIRPTVLHVFFSWPPILIQLIIHRCCGTQDKLNGQAHSWADWARLVELYVWGDGQREKCLTVFGSCSF